MTPRSSDLLTTIYETPASMTIKIARTAVAGLVVTKGSCDPIGSVRFNQIVIRIPIDIFIIWIDPCP
ncbi:hypothetical protein MTsPCn3_29230 [Erythrobacter sp. MTPC3]